MADEEVRRMMVNSVYYLLDLKAPAKADVELVGAFNPSAFQFHTDEYWEGKELKVSVNILE